MCKEYVKISTVASNSRVYIQCVYVCHVCNDGDMIVSIYDLMLIGVD